MSVKRSVAIALVGVLFTFLNAAPSSAHTKRFASSVDLDIATAYPAGDLRSMTGDVESPKVGCLGGRTVDILRVQDGDDPVVATTTSDPDGRYGTGQFEDPGKGMVYRARVKARRISPAPHRHICESDISAPKGTTPPGDGT